MCFDLETRRLEYMLVQSMSFPLHLSIPQERTQLIGLNLRITLQH